MSKTWTAFDGPVAVLMAGRDEVIPNAHTMRLFESLPGKKRLWVFEVRATTRGPRRRMPEWWAEVMDFVAPEPCIEATAGSVAGSQAVKMTCGPLHEWPQLTSTSGAIRSTVCWI